LLFCVLVAGPDEILFGRERLPFLLDPKLPFGDMADLAFIIGGAAVFDPGCMMTSRIETVLKPGMRHGVSPSYARTTTPGHGVVSLKPVVCAAVGFTTATEAAANHRATADLRFTFCIGVLLTLGPQDCVPIAD
jgi:hypothetical protein